jgi:Na+/melibiose symporter-like transporter
MMSFIPAACSILVTIAVWFYRLDDQLMEKIEQDLTQRKANETGNAQ